MQMSHIHPNAKKLVVQLCLQPHPEGGFFRETYRSGKVVELSASSTPEQWKASTGIYFMITDSSFSAFHRIRFDEMWHFYAGDPIEIFELDSAGTMHVTKLGPPFEPDCVCQHVVPGGAWFASRLAGTGDWALAGCTVAPGFDFKDFELANRSDLISQFPAHEEIIRILTRA